tara:strand:- start:1393 stop:2145 length:753 start_codon:yes stop_codon:yes gene_type:complete
MKMLDFRNTKEKPNNINAFHISPSSESKYLPNTTSLSKTKTNVVYEIDKPNTLYVGNNVHSAIEYSIENNKDLIDTYEIIVKTIGYRDSEYTRSVSQLSHANRYNNKPLTKYHNYKPKDTNFDNHNKLNYQVGLKACQWLLDNCLDYDNQRYEVKVNSVNIKNYIYSGTIDVLHRNQDGTYSLYDFKNYNGTSDYEQQVQLNQLYIYALMCERVGVKIKSIKVFNPLEQSINTRHLTDEFLQDFIDNQLR